MTDAPPPAPFDARALWTIAPGRAELRRERVEPAPGAAVVRTLRSAVSRGTERLVLAGRVPPSEVERMRAPFQDGDFPFPVKYGYMTVGRVEHGPADLAGRLVFALAPHQDRIALPPAALYPVPAGVPERRAVLAAAMETALTVVWDSGAGPGDRVLVVGAGVIGLLVAHLTAALPGADVTLVDVDPARATPAARLGLVFGDPGAAPADCDVVVNASASAEGLALAIAAAGVEASVVEASWYGDGAVPVPLGGAFHSRRLRIVGSQVGLVPPGRRIRWPARRRMAKALALLADDRLDVLLTGETPFSAAAEAYPAVLADPATLAHAFVHPSET